jgi:hypothetical protein
MVDDGIELRGIFPQAFIPGAIPPPAIILIMVDWLLQELDAIAEERWPVLKTMRGFRRKEIIAFMESQSDWTVGILNTKMVV